MESIISSLQNIPKPSFLRSNPNNNTGTTAQKQASSTSIANNAKQSVTNTFGKVSDIKRNKSQKKNAIELPAISFTDFVSWDIMPYNELFIRERLRRRIKANESEYAKHGIISQCVPLKEEIESIRDILFCGGTLSELRMNPNSDSLSVILSYSKSDAQPLTKAISQINDNELSLIINKYNDLRRSALQNQLCLLCGIYDIYFLYFILSIIKRENIKIIQQKLMQYFTKSLIYCLMNDNKYATLDLLNYEAINTLLSSICNTNHICFECRSQFKIRQNTMNDTWFSQLLNVLMNHGFNLNKMIKNASLKHETALMNEFNCEWMNLQQILMIQIPSDSNDDFINKWCSFCDNLLNEMQNMRNNKKEYEKFALEIQLTVFESFLKTVIKHKYLYKMIDFINRKMINFLNENDLLILLLFCGHFGGYKYQFNKIYRDSLNIFTVFESFDALLSVTNVISSNLKDIGKIIAIRSCLFHHKYNDNIDIELMNKYKMEFIWCLKILFYDYGLYYDKKKFNSNNDDEIQINYAEMISNGLRTQKKFLMECPYLDNEILQCLLELKIVCEAFIVDRFRNTFDFMEYEMNFNINEIWDKLQNGVFVYNKNVLSFRRMNEKDLRLLFRRMIRVVVTKEYTEWIKQFIMNDDSLKQMDKKKQIKKRAQIEDKYKLSKQTILLIQQYV